MNNYIYMCILTIIPLLEAKGQTHVHGTTRRANVEIVTTNRDTIYGEITLPYQYKRKIWINEEYVNSENIDFIIVNTIDPHLKHKLIYRKSINLRKGIWCKNDKSKGWYAEILSGYASLYYFGVQFNIDKKNGKLVCLTSDTRSLYGAKEGNTKVKHLARSDVLGQEKYFRRTMSKFLEDDLNLKSEILAGEYSIRDAENLVNMYNSKRESNTKSERN